VNKVDILGINNQHPLLQEVVNKESMKPVGVKFPAWGQCFQHCWIGDKKRNSFYLTICSEDGKWTV